MYKVYYEWTPKGKLYEVYTSLSTLWWWTLRMDLKIKKLIKLRDPKDVKKHIQTKQVEEQRLLKF